MKVSLFVDQIIERHIKDEELKRLLIAHSASVARKAIAVARECGMESEIDMDFVVEAAMLHDIGIVKCNAPSVHCHGELPYICHGIAGSRILADEGLDEKYRRVCERHTGSGLTAEEIRERNLPLPAKDFMPETLEEKLICYADKFYSKSGDPYAEKSLERVRASMMKHGEKALERFEELQRLFTPKNNSSRQAL